MIQEDFLCDKTLRPLTLHYHLFTDSGCTKTVTVWTLLIFVEDNPCLLFGKVAWGAKVRRANCPCDKLHVHNFLKRNYAKVQKLHF